MDCTDLVEGAELDAEYLRQSIKIPFRLFIELEQHLSMSRDIGKYVSNSQEG